MIAEKNDESETPAKISRVASKPAPLRASAATSNAVAIPAENPSAGIAAANSGGHSRDDCYRGARTHAGQKRIDERITQ